MSSISSDLGVHLTAHAFRGANILQGLLSGIEDVRARREERRQNGVDTVAELSLRYHEALDGEDAAIAAARALDAENARLRSELAAARSQAARAEARAGAAESLLARARRAILAAA